MKAWTVRDRCGQVILFPKVKPSKNKYEWYSSIRGYIVPKQDLPEGCNPQWTDNEPTEVELKIEISK